jgi:GNAT superfamily N-acetyltransferase
MTGAVVTIIRAGAEHYTRACAIVTEYLQMIRDWVNDEEVAAETQRHCTLPSHAVFLALERNDAVGCVQVHPLDGTRNFEIKRLYVRSDFRGRGIAAQLMSAAEEFALQQGAGYVYLDTKAGMLAAQTLYTGRGYERIAPYHETTRADVFMRKRL